jgi:hypothetical protein
MKSCDRFLQSLFCFVDDGILIRFRFVVGVRYGYLSDVSHSRDEMQLHTISCLYLTKKAATKK